MTGGRIKIGFYTALKLLRAGAEVIVSTRFAEDAALRYGAESDYSEWKSRLIIIEADFRNLQDVRSLILQVRDKFKSLDYLINNAAQTLARPEEFYQTIKSGDNQALITTSEYFPVGAVDEFNQQIDLRPRNSWKETIETVDLQELVDVLAINSCVPFFLIQNLYFLMKSESKDSFIINVSSMEGKFNRKKGDAHPHTNMAKASLNMITKTIGRSFRAKYGINVVSVDTGWNTIEDPLSYDKTAPLDCVDGAARILDPIFRELRFSEVFYKDFEITDW